MKATTKYNKDGSVNRIIEASNGDFAVDLFPYKIKNRELFYDRDHPVNISPESFEYEIYWNSKLKNYLEGRWVDDEGTWVFMPPKLDFYINYVSIVDEERRKIKPRLRDNAWILGTYDLCSEGFSGFELDEEYTCHDLVGRLEDIEKRKKQGEKNIVELQDWENTILANSKTIRKEDGTYKKYVNAWIYLTEHYLLTHKKDYSLGTALYENNKYDEMILACRSAEKALKPDELVLSENGWVKIKDINVGDKVYGSDGKLCNVLQKTGLQKNLDMYRIHLRDGRYIDACKNHLWKVWDKNKNRKGTTRDIYSILSTEDMFKFPLYNRVDSKYKKKYGEIRYVKESRYFLPLNECVEFDDSELPIDPYFMGIWLGDGHAHRAAITTEDKEIADYCYKIADAFNHKVKVSTKKDNKASTYYISNGRYVKDETRVLLNTLKGLNLIRNKHIPDIYLKSSREQRFELLRGLMDSDGSSSGGIATFSNSNKTLAYDVLELSRSLGMYAHISEKRSKLYGVEKKIGYRVYIKTEEKIFNLERKHLSHKEHKPIGVFGTGRLNRVAITDIERLDNHDGICIAVDSYDNTYITKDYIVTHNSFYSFGGSFAHEWLTNGAKTIEDFRKDGATQKLFGAGSPRKDQLERSLGIVKRLYNDMPGSYTYGVDTKGKADKVEGFLYKRVIGTWDVGSKTEHKVDNIDNTPAINGNVFQSAVITPDAVATFAGDRMAMILIEEVGFLGFVKTVRSAFRNSLEVGKRKIGKAKYLGTGGLAEEIREAKEMFESPDSFSIFPLPNYYDKNKGGNIGLFLSVVYQAEELKDENGNTVLEKALIDAIQKREREYENADSSSFWEFIAYNPLYPKEMLRPSTKSVLPVAEMSEWRGMLQEMNIWKAKASVGNLRWDAQEETKVAWKRDIEQILNPIHSWGKDKELLNREGCWVMYEDVMYPRPDNLYYILYDPAAQGGEGTSLHSILVYKHKFTGGDKSLQETFVAEFIGRKDSLEKNYEEVIKAAMYYNAKILPETNVPGFVDWCERKQYAHYLINEPRKVMTEVRRTPQTNYYRKGLRVDEHINRWSLNRYADWLNTPVLIDDDGTPMKRRFQNIYSLRLLDESINFVMDRKTEFDHMSSALLLMPLLLEIDEDVVEIVDEFEEFNKSKYSNQSLITNKAKQRVAILNY